MKPMTDVVREKIKVRIKNGLDISDLIDNVCIRNENLAGAIITKFNRVCDNISNCNLARTIIGTEGEITNLCGTVMKNCNFSNAKFISTVWMRRADARGANFNESFLAYLHYEYADFRDATFCGCVLKVGTKYGLGAQFSESFFSDLCDGWNVKVTKREDK